MEVKGTGSVGMTKATLTEEDISVQASALGRTRTNVDRENLSFGNLTAWDVDN